MAVTIFFPQHESILKAKIFRPGHGHSDGFEVRHGCHGISLTCPRKCLKMLATSPLNIYIYIIYGNIGYWTTSKIKYGDIWATLNIWYIAPSHQFLKNVLSFFRFWYVSKWYRFLKSVLWFSKPQLNFQKIKMSQILLSINLNFGCSSYENAGYFTMKYVEIHREIY